MPYAVRCVVALVLALACGPTGTVSVGDSSGTTGASDDGTATFTTSATSSTTTADTGTSGSASSDDASDEGICVVGSPFAFCDLSGPECDADVDCDAGYVCDCDVPGWCGGDCVPPLPCASNLDCEGPCHAGSCHAALCTTAADCGGGEVCLAGICAVVDTLPACADGVFAHTQIDLGAGAATGVAELVTGGVRRVAVARGTSSIAMIEVATDGTLAVAPALDASPQQPTLLAGGIVFIADPGHDDLVAADDEVRIFPGELDSGFAAPSVLLQADSVLDLALETHDLGPMTLVLADIGGFRSLWGFVDGDAQPDPWLLVDAEMAHGLGPGDVRLHEALLVASDHVTSVSLVGGDIDDELTMSDDNLAVAAAWLPGRSGRIALAVDGAAPVVALFDPVAPQLVLPLDGAPSSLTVADVDADGSLDVVVGTESGLFVVLGAAGAPSCALALPTASAIVDVAAAAMDLDAPGASGHAVVGVGGSELHRLRPGS